MIRCSCGHCFRTNPSCAGIRRWLPKVKRVQRRTRTLRRQDRWCGITPSPLAEPRQCFQFIKFRHTTQIRNWQKRTSKPFEIMVSGGANDILRRRLSLAERWAGRGLHEMCVHEQNYDRKLSSSANGYVYGLFVRQHFRLKSIVKIITISM